MRLHGMLRAPSLALCVALGPMAYVVGASQSTNATSAQNIAILKKQAAAGNARAQAAVASDYANGQGVRQDYVQAVVWRRKAAEQGNAAAQFNLGMAYHNGQGVPKNGVQAVFWLYDAAEQG